MRTKAAGREQDLGVLPQLDDTSAQESAGWPRSRVAEASCTKGIPQLSARPPAGGGSPASGPASAQAAPQNAFHSSVSP